MNRDAPPAAATAILQPGATCWRVEPAERVAFLVDGDAYFRALDAVMRRARRSILILGWDFDPRMRLRPEEGTKLGDLLHGLARRRRGLVVRALRWDTPFPITLEHPQVPMRRLNRGTGRVVRARPDSALPPGAAQHQKIVVVDDAMAFCGGIDLAGDRWDTPAHLDHDPRRRWPTGAPCPPRHDVMLAVDGRAARALVDLVHQRWAAATGETVPRADPSGDLWPPDLLPDLTGVSVGIARTRPRQDGEPEIRENEALHLAAIKAARRSIYLENQYFASHAIADALARRLADPEGPEVVIVNPLASPSWFDQFAMDKARSVLLHRLRQADRFGRLRAVMPLTADGSGIIVHSKVSVIDDRMIRVGSANLNQRSMGYDTECDLALEAVPGDAAAPRIAQAARDVRTGLLAEHLGVAPMRLSLAEEQEGSLVRALDRLRKERGKRLVPLPDGPPGPIARAIAALRFADPARPEEAWAPWTRVGPGAGRALAAVAAAAALAGGVALVHALRHRRHRPSA